MIPLCDLVPCRTRPLATLGLGVVTAAGSVALWAALAGSSIPPARLGMAPATWTLGGSVGSLLAHLNLGTAVANLLALWLFGPTVEDRLGRPRFMMLWVVSGAAAVAAHIAIEPHSTALLLGGVGATAGVVGANLSLHIRGRFLAVMPVVMGFDVVDLPAWLYAAVWLSVLPLATFAPLTALLAACAAGAAVGAVLARLTRQPDRMRIEWWGP